MTESEKAFCESVHRQCMDLVGTLGNLTNDAEPGSRQQRRAKRAALAALALAGEAARRITDAEMKNDVAELEATGYDLAALAAAPPATIED